MYLLLTECHQDDRNKEIQHHKGHKHNAGANEKSAKHRIVIENLKYNQILCRDVSQRTPMLNFG